PPPATHTLSLHDALPISFARPSTVVILEPSACTAKMVHDLALRPSTSTVHAPHWLVSQPTCAPVRRSCSRKKWTRSRRGSTSPRSEEHTSELQSRSDLVC